MDQKALIDILSGQTRGPGASALRCGLAAASWPYGAVAGLRRKLYRWGVLPSKSAGVGVISVGNVTTGGTGKTPMVAWITRQLAAAGAKPAVLMRGYRSSRGISEEAELLRESAGCEVAVNPDRVAGASGAVLAGADVLIMDDGFQHRRLRRDLDIVLIDATRPFGFGHCLPRGLLREPISALRDADAIVITHSDKVSPARLEDLSRRVSRIAPAASMHKAVHRPVNLLCQDGQKLPIESLAGRNVLAFCGIGRPDSFFTMLEKLGANVSETLVFDDHVEYTSERLASIQAATVGGGIDAVVTTYKDIVKLGELELTKPLWTLVVEIEVTERREELLEKMKKVWLTGRDRPSD